MPEVEVSEVPVVSDSYEGENGNKHEDNLLQEVDKEGDDVKEEWLDVLGSGDLKIKTLKEGTPGTRPQTSDIVTINIKCELEDGTFVSDETDVEIEVNGSEVVQALDLVLALLDVGQKVTAIVKPRFGYGSIGLPPNIPENATLVYTIELTKVTLPKELTNTPFSERINKASFKKTKGNWWYSRGEANKAVICYRAALNALEVSTPYIDEQDKVIEMPEDVFREMVQQKIVVYNNLAAAQLLINAYESALMSVENVLKIEPNNVKALFRMGKIYVARGLTEEAIEAFNKVLAVEPGNVAAKKELNSALKRQIVENSQAKSLYKKMFSEPTDTETKSKEVKKRNPTDKNGLSLWTKILGAAATATVAALFAYNYKSIAA